MRATVPLERGLKESRKRLPRKEILSMLAKGLRPTVIARDLGISRLSVYRVKGELPLAKSTT